MIKKVIYIYIYIYIYKYIINKTNQTEIDPDILKLIKIVTKSPTYY